jgi:hypothetical protein
VTNNDNNKKQERGVGTRDKGQGDKGRDKRQEEEDQIDPKTIYQVSDFSYQRPNFRFSISDCPMALRVHAFYGIMESWNHGIHGIME